MREKHDIVADSLNFRTPVRDKWQARYTPVFQLKSNGLLMDEATMKYYSQVLGMHPKAKENIHECAIKYVLALLRIFETVQPTPKKFELLKRELERMLREQNSKYPTERDRSRKWTD